MRTFYRLVVMLLLILQSGYVFSVTSSAQTIARGNEFDRSSLLVQFKENVVGSDIANIASNFGATFRTLMNLRERQCAHRIRRCPWHPPWIQTKCRLLPSRRHGRRCILW